jgi:hypothetical protein
VAKQNCICVQAKGVPVVLKQMILWGGTGGIVGAVIGDKSSYDPSGGAALYGCGIGIVIAVAFVWLFKGRNLRSRGQGPPWCYDARTKLLSDAVFMICGEGYLALQAVSRRGFYWMNVS